MRACSPLVATGVFWAPIRKDQQGNRGMKDVLTFLQNADAIAFAVLGAVTALVWAKRRDRSLGFLALAIVLLSLVSLLGRIPAAFTPPLPPQLSLVAFVGSGYALVRFRGSLIPVSPRWHGAAAARDHRVRLEIALIDAVRFHTSVGPAITPHQGPPPRRGAGPPAGNSAPRSRSRSPGGPAGARRPASSPTP